MALGRVRTGLLLALAVCSTLFAGTRPPAPTATPTPAPTPLVGLPPSPVETGLLSGAGYQLILDFEVGGGESYYSRYLARPTWPGASSGVTVGVGYDLGYNSKAVILRDWSALPSGPLNRLAATAGVTGAARAKPLIPGLRDILIQWKLAEGVFNDVTITRFYQLTSRTFPGLEALHPNAQAALVSLVFNRGSSMAGDSRREMREIRDLVPKRDYPGIAAAIRSMTRIWKGTSVEKGLTRRRLAEAALVESAAR